MANQFIIMEKSNTGFDYPLCCQYIKSIMPNVKVWLNPLLCCVGCGKFRIFAAFNKYIGEVGSSAEDGGAFFMLNNFLV